MYVRTAADVSLTAIVMPALNDS